MSALYSQLNMFIYGFKSHHELLGRLSIHDKSSDEGFLRLLSFYLNSNVGENVNLRDRNLEKMSYMCYHFICKAIINRILFYCQKNMETSFVRSNMISKSEDKVIQALKMRSRSSLEVVNSEISLAKEDRRDYTSNAVNYLNSYRRVKKEIVDDISNMNLEYNSDSILRTYRYLRSVLELMYYYSVYSSYNTNMVDIQKQYDLYINSFNMSKANIDFSKLKIMDRTIASLTMTNMNILTAVNDESSQIEMSQEALNYIKCNIILSRSKMMGDMG